MSKKNQYYQYYVEGPDDEKIVNTLKKDYMCINSGKVSVFNVIQNRLNKFHTMQLKSNTIVILIYDTDVEDDSKIAVLRNNIDFLKKQANVSTVLCLPQVKNLEDELIRSCNIKHVCELTLSKSNKNYKSDLISCRNLHQRLEYCNFDIKKFWNLLPENKFKPFGNHSSKIKL